MIEIEKIKKSFEENSCIQGKVIHVGKAFILVRVCNYPCIMTKNEVEPFFVKDFDSYLHKNIHIKVLNIESNESGGWNIWVSHKQISEEIVSQNAIEGFESLKKLHSYHGVISNINQHGIFVYLGSFTGFIPARNLENNYKEYYSIGDYVTAKITKIDKETQKILLSLEDPLSLIHI